MYEIFAGNIWKVDIYVLSSYFDWIIVRPKYEDFDSQNTGLLSKKFTVYYKTWRWLENIQTF